MHTSKLFVLRAYVIVGFFLIFSLFLSALNISYAQSDEVQEEFKRILEKGYITIAVHSNDAKPFYYQNEDGEFTGFDVDIAKDIAKRLGVDAKFNRDSNTFNGLVDLVLQKEADIVISMLSNTLNRAMKVRFSEPYITLYRTVAVNRLEMAKRRTRKNTQIKEDLHFLLSLKEIKIGSIADSSYMDFLKEDFPNATRVPYKDWNTVMKAVLTGEVLAGLNDNITASNWASNHLESGIYVKTILLREKKDTLSFAVHNENEYLLQWLNLYISKVKDDGTYTKLIKKYFPDQQVNSK